MVTKLEYQAGLIKEESTSELLRFTIRHIINQVHNQPEYLILKQQKQQVEKNWQQQQLHNQVILSSATTSHRCQVPKISRRDNLGSQKMIPWKLSSLLSMQTNHRTFWW